MNDEAARQGRPANSNTLPQKVAGRPAAIPAVVVVRPLEGREFRRLVCQTYEEELRLRAELEGRRAA
jgi:hypothetical protein